MTTLPPIDETQTEESQGSRALRSAQAALARIQGVAEAALADQITPAEAVEQVLDELAVRPSLSRSFSPSSPH